MSVTFHRPQEPLKDLLELDFIFGVVPNIIPVSFQVTAEIWKHVALTDGQKLRQDVI